MLHYHENTFKTPGSAIYAIYHVIYLVTFGAFTPKIARKYAISEIVNSVDNTVTFVLLSRLFPQGICNTVVMETCVYVCHLE